MQNNCKRTNVLEVFENIYTSLYMLIVLYVLIDGQWKSEKMKLSMQNFERFRNYVQWY